MRVFRNEYFITKHIIITRHDLFEIRYMSVDFSRPNPDYIRDKLK